MAILFIVTAWLLLATSIEVSGRGDVLVASVQVQTNSLSGIEAANKSVSQNPETANEKNTNVSEVAENRNQSEVAPTGNQNQDVVEPSGTSSDSTSSPTGALQTSGTTPSVVNENPIVNIPNPIGIGGDIDINSTTADTKNEIIQEPTGSESQPIASTTASPVENAAASGTNELNKPAETSAATVEKGPRINEIVQSVTEKSVKSVVSDLQTTTPTSRPTTTTSIVNALSDTGNESLAPAEETTSTSSGNATSTPGNKSPATAEGNTSTSTGSEAGVSQPNNTSASTGNEAITNTNATITSRKESSNATSPTAKPGKNSSTTEVPSAEPTLTPTKNNAIEPTGNATAEPTNENKTSASSGNKPSIIPSNPDNNNTAVQTIPTSSDNSSTTLQTIPEEPLNSTVQTIPAQSKNSSTIQTIPATRPLKEPRTNPTTIVGDLTFVGISETSSNSTSGNGTIPEFSNSTISNMTTLVPPLVPTKTELLKRRIEKDTVSIRKNLEKRLAYYNRTIARMTSLLQTIRKRNKLTETALAHLPVLLEALITEPTQRLKLSQLFAAANALQPLTSGAGAEATSDPAKKTTVVAPSQVAKVSNVTA